MAERAAISVSWYTWLEQGRDIHVSNAVLDKIADSLLLDTTQREYLYTLARTPGNGHPLMGTPEEIPSPILQILTAHEPNPGYLINNRFDVVAWNQATLDVFGDLSKLPASERNVLHLLFGMLRPLIVNWEPNARFVVNAFRASTSADLDEPWLRQLVAELAWQHRDFRRWWADCDVELRPVTHKQIAHPLVGAMVLEQTALQLDDRSGRRLILYTPMSGTDTDIKLGQLSLRDHRPLSRQA